MIKPGTWSTDRETNKQTNKPRNTHTKKTFSLFRAFSVVRRIIFFFIHVLPIKGGQLASKPRDLALARFIRRFLHWQFFLTCSNNHQQAQRICNLSEVHKVVFSFKVILSFNSLMNLPGNVSTIQNIFLLLVYGGREVWYPGCSLL